ncbi:unnamed protein product, partial [Symbiodinium sp. CCMP2456]
TYLKFKPVYEGVMLITVLSRRLLWEDFSSILSKFRQNVADSFPSLGHLNSDKSFITTVGLHLQNISEQVGFTTAQLLKAEYEDFQALGLAGMKHRQRSAKRQKALEQIEGDLCFGMRKFLGKVKGVEEGGGMVGDPHHLFHMWQEAMGAVRVIVKVTTQCRIEVPPEYDAKSFMTRQHQDQWKTCNPSIPYMEDEFPSAVMACARSDEAHPKYGGQDRNRVVRYMGCGKSRVKVEPPVSRVVTEGCLSVGEEDDPELTDFLNQMCSAQGISDRSCRLYGPFYGVYSHLAEDLFGYHSLKEKEECLAIAATNLENAAAQEEQEAEAAPTPKRGNRGRGSLLEDEREEEDEQEECADPQATAFIGQANRAMAEYIYGLTPPLSYSKSRAWSKKETKLKETSWDPKTMDWPLPQDRQLDPPLSEILREAEAGEGLMMISYGYSGAGKTTTLIGDATAPLGGGRGIDGVLSVYLKENAHKIDDVKVKIFEVYGRVSTQTGHMKKNTGSGIWAYKLKEKVAQYLGTAEAFMVSEPDQDDDEWHDPEEEENRPPRHAPLDMQKLQATLDKEDYTYSVKAESPASMSGTVAWQDEVKKLLTVIEDIRIEEDQFKAGGEPIAHIRGTVNNPKSSRGTLFVLTNIHYKSGKVAPVSTVDLAGSEDPAVMVSGFLRFVNREGRPECDPAIGKTPAQLMAKYLANLSSYEEMSGSLSWCYELKDVLEECDKTNPQKGCVDVTLTSGKTEFLRPNLNKPELWHRKDERGVDLPGGLRFIWTEPETGRGKPQEKAVFYSYEEIFEMKSQGTPPGLSDHRKETNPLGPDWYWAERLWARCLKDKKTGKCRKNSPGVVDHIILCPKSFKPTKANPSCLSESTYSKIGSNPSPLTEVPGKLTVIQKADKNFGKWKVQGQKGKQPGAEIPEVIQWKETRKWFFESLKGAMDDWAAMLANEEFDRHLRYFTSAIGPVVEEAFFINEALNDMKGYLGIWAKESQMQPAGTILDIWPPADLEVKGKINQVVDYSPGSKISEQGYSIYDFIKPRGEEKGYAQQLAHGEDNIMLVAMLEYIRGISVRSGQNTKVLVATFIRSDIPAADLNCEGARASLEFAQDLSEMVGWSRGLPGVLPHFHNR